MNLNLYCKQSFGKMCVLFFLAESALATAKALALTAIEVLSNPEILEAVKTEHHQWSFSVKTAYNGANYVFHFTAFIKTLLLFKMKYSYKYYFLKT